MKIIFFITIICVHFNFKNTKKLDKIIVPNERVGKITKYSSEKSLIIIYGRENVVRDSINLGEGTYEIGTKLFSNTIDELQIRWKDKVHFSKPMSICLRGKKSNWKTKEGITLGTNLKTLEKLNNDSFYLLGFGWDYQGTITNWNKGVLSKNINLHNNFFRLNFKNPRKINYSKIQEIMGDKELKSSNKILQKLNPIIDKILLTFEI